MGGRETQKSFEALKGLMEYAKARSTHQILLMTWGYLHGDGVDHPAIFPDYHAMQVMILRCPSCCNQCKLISNGLHQLFTRKGSELKRSSILVNSMFLCQVIMSCLCTR